MIETPDFAVQMPSEAQNMGDSDRILLPYKQEVAGSCPAPPTTKQSCIPRKTKDMAGWLAYHREKIIARRNAKNKPNPVNSAVLLPSSAGAPSPFVPIPLNRGKHAIVDLEDYDRVAGHHWFVRECDGSRLYADYHVPGTGKHGKKESMHRFILGAKPGEIVDHINGDGLDNRRCNLRLCTTAQNIRNSKIYSRKATSKYKGVYKDRHGRIRAQIMCAGHKINLGTFPDELSAAHCYDDNARRLFGDFARPNFADGGAHA